MPQRVYSAIIILCLILTGCDKTATNKSFDQIKQELSSIRSYTCEVQIKISNNKSTMAYRLMHTYKKPDKFRAEIIEPVELKGQSAIFNGKTAYIYHPAIHQYLQTDNLSGVIEQDAFIGNFIWGQSDGEKYKIYADQSGELSYYVIERSVAGGSRYKDKERLWLDARTGVPVKAEMLDTEGKATVQILYSNFKINMNLDDTLFEINKS